MPKFTINGTVRSFASKSCELRVRWRDKEYAKDMAAISKATWEDPAKREQLTQARRDCWPEEKRERYARRLWGASKNKIESGRRTEGEAALEKALIELGIPYLFEHNIGRYWVDFALPSLKVVIECDGTWHLPRKEQDARRNAFLESDGWRVIRIPSWQAVRGARRVLCRLLKPLL